MDASPMRRRRRLFDVDALVYAKGIGVAVIEHAHLEMSAACLPVPNRLDADRQDRNRQSCSPHGSSAVIICRSYSPVVRRTAMLYDTRCSVRRDTST